MEAPSLGRNFTVEWDEADEDERSWEEIIESLKVNASITQRLVLPRGMHPWEDSARSDGMLSLLQTEPFRSNPDWDIHHHRRAFAPGPKTKAAPPEAPLRARSARTRHKPGKRRSK